MNITTIEDVIAAKKNANVIPVCKSVFADTETPVSTYMKLCKGEPYSFLLESADGDGSYARYSFVGADPYMIFSSAGTQWKIFDRSTNHERAGEGDPVVELRKFFANYKHAQIKDMPRFCGGAVGYFSYDAIRLFENIPRKNKIDNDAADIFFAFYRDIVVFDNKKQRLMYISNIFADDAKNIETQYENALANMANMEAKMDAACSRMSANRAANSTLNIKTDFEKELFEEAVVKCKEYILAGDIFQVVLSRKFTVDIDAEPFDIYRSLRIVNPSPYMFYLSLDKFNVIGASPEMLVRVENCVVENRPIAGTRRRGATLAEDERLAEELKNDPKEIAEHVMLVDLGRNDVGRVCEYGSVEVENMMHIEKYSHVIHMVTDIRGKLKKDRDAFDALFSCFPAGTLSGAPKIRAMEIIDELEPCGRGLYGGAMGYIDFSGNMDTCIVIRTMVYKDGVASIQAGAGIVADSVPSRECEETVEKASALFAAISRDNI